MPTSHCVMIELCHRTPRNEFLDASCKDENEEDCKFFPILLVAKIHALYLCHPIIQPKAFDRYHHELRLYGMPWEILHLISSALPI